jgi:microcompartment protein CcmK/EutM
MILARVIGTVVCTQKDPKLEGVKLQMVQPVDVHARPDGKPLVAVDTVGAGQGEIVLVVSGSSARQTVRTQNTPVDAVIMAIVDTVDLEGKITYEKAAGGGARQEG